MFACNGILFNHESPIRGETFVTRKVTRAMSRIALGMQEKVYMGNLASKRDWGHAKDYIEAQYLILQQDTPSDYVIATGITTSIRDFIRMAGNEVGIEIEFEGEGVHEQGFIASIDTKKFTNTVGSQFLEKILHRAQHNKYIVGVDPAYFRPTEVDLLIGDPTKSQTILGWKPKYDLPALVQDMMQSDVKLMQKNAYLQEGGYRTMNYFE